jgi:hypothetical protein
MFALRLRVDSFLGSLLKTASCLRARSLTRSLRRSICAESADSTPFSLLDLEPDPEPSATEPFFNWLSGALLATVLVALHGHGYSAAP